MADDAPAVTNTRRRRADGGAAGRQRQVPLASVGQARFFHYSGFLTSHRDDAASQIIHRIKVRVAAARFCSQVSCTSRAHLVRVGSGALTCTIQVKTGATPPPSTPDPVGGDRRGPCEPGLRDEQNLKNFWRGKQPDFQVCNRS